MHTLLVVLVVLLLNLNLSYSNVVKSFKDERVDKIRKYLQGFEIHIVWNAYINPSNPCWLSILHGQWNQLYRSDLADLAETVNVELIVKEEEPDSYIKALGLIKSLTPNANITRHQWTPKLFEFPGIDRVWRIAENTGTLQDNRLILYFHTKCMMHNQSRKPPDADGRCINDRTMFKYVISPWPRIVTLFKDHPQLNRAGLAQSLEGFIWGNFYWVRSAYVAQQLNKPVLHLGSRFYYEHWVSNITSNSSAHTGGGASLCPFLPPSSASLMVGKAYHNRPLYKGRWVERIPCWDKDPFTGSMDPFPGIDQYDREGRAT
jgi:hypothetical protein